MMPLPFPARTICSLLAAGCFAVCAQTPVAQPAASVPEVIAVAEIAQRAEADEQFAAAVRRRAETVTGESVLEQRLASLADSHVRLQRALRPVRVEALPLRRLESLERHWRFLARDLGRWHEDLQSALRPLSNDAEQLATRRRAWEATLAAQQGGDTPWDTRARQALARIDAAERALARPGAALFELSRSAGAIDGAIAAGLEQARQQIHARDRNLLRLDAPPLWSAVLAPRATRAAADLARQGLAIEIAFARDYDARFARSRNAMTVAMLALLPMLMWVSRRTRARARLEPLGDASLAVLSRPFAAWIVLYAIASLLFHWDGPVIRLQATLLVAWLPVLRLLPASVRRALGPWAWISAAFYALNFAASLLAIDPLAYRAALAALAAALLATLLWLARRHRHRIEASAARTRTLWLLRGSALLATLALLANVLGNVSLATVLLDGLLDATYLALALAAVAAVVGALSDTLWRSSVRAMPARVGARAGSLRRAAVALGGLVLAAAWLLATLNAFRVLRPAYSMTQALLGQRIAFGGMDFALGSVALFLVAAAVAWWIARTLRDLLAEDVLPAMALPRGVAHSISTLSYYALIGIGLLLALGLSGFELSQLAIVFGALGVGVGLGLQDVVRNFVSGLILMVERPIQPGDVVEVNGVSGRVREIGLRATRLATFDGADVVLPNGLLVAERLTNWTLCNSHRRIEMSVGVASDSDPQQVLALLRRVAAETPGVLAEPPPVALFTGFGASSLDFSLRAWTREDSEWAETRSQMGLSVLAALRAAGIGIPYPQQDLHLRSASPEVAALLAQSAFPHMEPPRA